jgi:N-acetylmuramoyl-L-alanine amidase
MTKLNCVLMIGHSEKAQGARNENYKITEWIYNSLLADDIISRIKKIQNYPVEIIEYVLTGPTNFIKEINSINPDFVVSMHCNSFNKKVSGTEMLCYYKSKRSLAVATIFQCNTLNALQLKSRGIKFITFGKRGYLFLKKTKMPAIITEPFFIDNDSDFERAIKRRDNLIHAYIKSIRETAVYLRSHK